jgi:hypothetical protein
MIWPFGKRESPVVDAGPTLVENDVLANFSASAVDIRWWTGGADIFGIRMSIESARTFAANILSACDALDGSQDVDLSPENLEDE